MKKYVKILLFLFVFSFIGIYSVNAKQVIKLKECEYTEEYKKWTKLSKKEKEKVLMPQICKIANLGGSLNTNVGSALGSITQEKFDLRDVDGESYVTSIKDQNPTGSCWTYATNASIESNLLVNGYEEYDLSETHMELSTQNTFPIKDRMLFKRAFNGGGQHFISSAYLLNRRGSVLEMKYPDSIIKNLVKNNATTYSESEMSKIAAENAILQVGGVARLIKASDSKCGKEDVSTAQIKNYLVNYGALYASINFDTPNQGAICEEDGNTCITKSDTHVGPYFYYSGSEGINHAVTIVGWDDTIKKENFNENNRPNNDGAWIVKNSWGLQYEASVSGENKNILVGDDGYYYVSYEDTNICSNLAGFYDVDPNVNDNAYSTAELGFLVSLELSGTDLYSGAIYTKNNSSNQKIDKISFGSGVPGMNYEVYYANNGTFTNLTKIASGTTKYAGYESVDLTSNAIISSDKFSVVVKYTGVNGKTYLPVTLPLNNSAWENFEGVPNMTYISLNGSEWEDTAGASFEEELLKMNTIMHVYTNDTEEVPPTTTASTTKATTTTTTTKKEDKPNGDGSIIVEPNEKNDGTVIETEKPEKNPSTSQSDVSFIMILGLVLLGIVGLSVLKLRKLKD